MVNKNVKRNISILNIIIIMFIIVLLITISSIGYLVFSNWLSSSRQIVGNMAQDMNQNIYHKIDMLINVPVIVNEFNHTAIENNLIDLSNEVEREKFFVNVLSSSSKEIYSFSFGTANGEYYGARRNENDEIEIMRNNADTNGHSWYYSVKDNLTSGDLVLKAGEFDPRTREWY